MTINIIINEHIISNIEFSLELLFRNTILCEKWTGIIRSTMDQKWTENEQKREVQTKYKQKK